jgi:hypothetical protein
VLYWKNNEVTLTHTTYIYYYYHYINILYIVCSTKSSSSSSKPSIDFLNDIFTNFSIVNNNTNNNNNNNNNNDKSFDEVDANASVGSNNLFIKHKPLTFAEQVNNMFFDKFQLLLNDTNVNGGDGLSALQILIIYLDEFMNIINTTKNNDNRFLDAGNI